MKRVLLIGKINDYYRQINKTLMETYEVKTCVNQLEIFKKMMDVNKTDVIVIVYDKWTDKEEIILREIHAYLSMIPAVCVDASKDEDVVEMIEKVLDGRMDSMVNFVPEQEELPKTEEIPEVDELPKKETYVEIEDNPFMPQRSVTPIVQEIKRKKSILLVDDSGLALRTIKSLIGDEYDVRMTTSGLNALSIIQENRPDLILLDYEMPIYDGKQTMMHIRESEFAKDIPIVFVTAVKKAENIKAVLNLKPEGYLLKPVEKDRLMQTIKDIIGE